MRVRNSCIHSGGSVTLLHCGAGPFGVPCARDWKLAQDLLILRAAAMSRSVGCCSVWTRSATCSPATRLPFLGSFSTLQQRHLENVFDWRSSLFWQRGENRGEKSAQRKADGKCEGRVTFSQRSNPRKHCALRCTSFVGRGHSFPACLYAEIASTTYTVPVLLKICSSCTLLCCGGYGMKVLLCSNAKRYKRAT